MIGFLYIRDADHAIAGAACEGCALQGLTVPEQVEFSQPVTLLKGGEGVLLPQGRCGGLMCTSKR